MPVNEKVAVAKLVADFQDSLQYCAEQADNPDRTKDSQELYRARAVCWSEALRHVREMFRDTLAALEAKDAGQ